MKALIGIDTGVNTGLALMVDGKLEQVIGGLSITQAMKNVLRYAEKHEAHLIIEDARKRKWITGGREKLQGAGSVKRDAKIWEDFCNENELSYELIAPQKGLTKFTAEHFRRVTGWPCRTNEHGRDAAMLIWGRRDAK